MEKDYTDYSGMACMTSDTEDSDIEELFVDEDMDDDCSMKNDNFDAFKHSRSPSTISILVLSDESNVYPIKTKSKLSTSLEVEYNSDSIITIDDDDDNSNMYKENRTNNKNTNENVLLSIPTPLSIETNSNIDKSPNNIHASEVQLTPGHSKSPRESQNSNNDALKQVENANTTIDTPRSMSNQLSPTKELTQPVNRNDTDSSEKNDTQVTSSVEKEVSQETQLISNINNNDLVVNQKDSNFVRNEQSTQELPQAIHNQNLITVNVSLVTQEPVKNAEQKNARQNLAKLNIVNSLNDKQSSTFMDDLISVEARVCTDLPITPNAQSLPDTPMLVDMSGFSDQLESALNELNIDDLTLLNSLSNNQEDDTIETINRLLNELPPDDRVFNLDYDPLKDLKIPNLRLNQACVRLNRLTAEEIEFWTKKKKPVKNNIKIETIQNSKVKKGTRKRIRSTDTIYSNEVSEDENENFNRNVNIVDKNNNNIQRQSLRKSFENTQTLNKERIVLKIDKTKLNIQHKKDNFAAPEPPVNKRARRVSSDTQSANTNTTNSSITIVKKSDIVNNNHKQEITKQNEVKKPFKIPKLVPKEEQKVSSITTATTKKTVLAKPKNDIKKASNKNDKKKDPKMTCNKQPLFPELIRLQSKETNQLSTSTAKHNPIPKVSQQQTQFAAFKSTECKIPTISLNDVTAESTITKLVLANSYESIRELSVSHLQKNRIYIEKLIDLMRKSEDTSNPFEQRLKRFKIDNNLNGLLNTFNHNIEKCKGKEEINSILSLLDLATDDELISMFQLYDSISCAPKRVVNLINDPSFLWSDDSMNIRVTFTNNGYIGGSCIKPESSVLYIMHNPQHHPNFIAYDLNKHHKTVDEPIDPKKIILEELINKDKLFFEELTIRKMVLRCDKRDLSTFELLRNHTKHNFKKKGIVIDEEHIDKPRFENYREFNTPNRGSHRICTTYLNTEFRNRLELYKQLLGYDLMASKNF